MKNLISLLILLTLFFACNEKKETELPSESQDNIQNDSVSVEVKRMKNQSLLELNSTQATQYLNTKNDTLYVTNFFATWCRPCVIEIPHFKEKIEELDGKPVKFTFISLDNKENWDEDVEKFVDDFGIRNHTVLLDPSTLDDQFFKNNFSDWKGEYIPFTILRKGNQTKEISGSISKSELDSQIKAFH